MDYSTFMETIQNSYLEDWLYDDDFGRYVLKSDIRISIISDKDDYEDREFHEEWATNFSDSRAVRARFFLCFNGCIIEAFYTAAVDGYRMLIPYPEAGSRSITNRKYKIGKILNIPYCNVVDRYDEYLGYAGFKRIG